MPTTDSDKMPLEFPSHEFIRREDPETAEITVEGEPWTGLVVVADTRGQGIPEYGLVQASEWTLNIGLDDPEREVVVWKGPEKRDERIARKNLAEMECQTVLVDQNGFYTCPPQVDLVRDEVLALAPKLMDQEANQRFAESQSYGDYETVREEYDTDDVLAITRIGDAVAVNGEYDNPPVKIPRGWVKLEKYGGRTMGGEEEEIDLDYIAQNITEDLTEKLKRPIDKKDVEKILVQEYGGSHGYIIWGADSGDVEIYIPRKIFLAHEKEEERKARIAEEKRERELEKRRREEQEERRRKIQRGGWPNPKDWSPTGEL